MELTPEWIKAEHAQVLDESIRVNTETLLRMCQVFYNLGLEVGQYTGRLKTLDQVLEALEKPRDAGLSHADGVQRDGKSDGTE